MYQWAPGSGLFTPRLTEARSKGQTTMAHRVAQSGISKVRAKMTGGRAHFRIGVCSKPK